MPANLENSAVATGLQKVVFISFQRNTMPSNAKTTTKLHSSHPLAKQCSKFSKQGFNSTANWELPDVQAGFRKGRETRDQIDNIRWITEKVREFQKIFYFCFIDYTKAFDFVDHNKLENSSRDGNTRPPYLPSEKSVCRSRSNRTRHGTTDWFQLGKGVRQVVYCHPAYLTYMQSTSCEMSAEWSTSWNQDCWEKYQ